MATTLTPVEADGPTQDDRPHVGGWGWAIGFFGFFGGLVGYFSLKDNNPRRANHVMKWGFIWSLLCVGMSVVLMVAASTLLVSSVTHSLQTVPANSANANSGRYATDPNPPATPDTSNPAQATAPKALPPSYAYRLYGETPTCSLPPVSQTNMHTVSLTLARVRIYAGNHHDLACMTELFGGDAGMAQTQMQWLDGFKSYSTNVLSLTYFQLGPVESLGTTTNVTVEFNVGRELQPDTIPSFRDQMVLAQDSTGHWYIESSQVTLASADA